jgi:dipeptidyl aminopeptidase/acylaminoacyl peptidase
LLPWSVLLLALTGCGPDPTPRATEMLRGASLAEARLRHQTKLLVQTTPIDPYDAAVPPGAELVQYRSAGRELFAWLARPAGQGPFPAVLYCHAGYALGPGDFEAIKPFLAAGYVVLLPAWRGENGNAGHFEMGYGEVDDAAAALAYLATVPEVNRQQLFAAGHDAGATIVMLLAESTTGLRGAAACGGIPDVRLLTESKRKPVLDHTPYDWRDPLELDLRSPTRHLQHLSCPLLLVYGEREPEELMLLAAHMEATGSGLRKPVQLIRLPGADHNTAIDAAVPRMIKFFDRQLGRTGP